MPSGMISTPGTGCSCASLLSSASAGGQLEQPSDVKRSTTTGTWADGAGVDCAAAMINISAVSKLDLISALSTQHPAPSTQHPLPLVGFDVDRDLDLVADDGACFDQAVVLQTEVAAVERRRGRRADLLAALLRLDRGRRSFDVQRHFLRHAVHRQVANQLEASLACRFCALRL